MDSTERVVDVRVSQMTLEEASSHISRAVYEATLLFERLEGAGLLHGNGHHARQKLAQLAVEDLRARWKGPTVSARPSV